MAGVGIPNLGPANIASFESEETITPASSDLVPVIDVSDSNRLKTATVSGINSGGIDAKVGVDAAATPDYLGAASSDGALRSASPLSYTDGGNFVTMGIDTTATMQIAKIGVGAANDQGTAQITTGDSGATADGNSDDLIVENNGNAGISILTPDGANTSKLTLGAATVPLGMAIQYTASTKGCLIGPTSSFSCIINKQCW
jgi:hypothetical protein